jgi:Asp-tRNA(Asn)/Glu-tRNA(Gln) amidotransferase A subunit family amidase
LLSNCKTRTRRNSGDRTLPDFSELVRLNACEMALAVRERRVSPVELVQAHLDQIARLNPALNAFVDLGADAALQDAQDIRRRLDCEEETLGPLAGVPISIKACIDVAGMRCESGTRLRAGRIATQDAVLVSRLRAAGAIVLGVTNTPEMLMAYETANLVNGTTNSAWDLTRTPGGSSGGEAAAISACMSAGGIGSDAGGSVRVPSHYSGICGLKPTPGRIPATGHFPESLGPFALLGVVGPMARNVADLKLLFQAVAGPDDGDTSAAPVPLQVSAAAEIKKLRIGYLESDDELGPVDPEIAAAVRNAADVVRESGFSVEPVQLGFLRRARELWWTIFVRLGAELNREAFRGREAEISPVLQNFLDIAAADQPLTKAMLIDGWFGRDQLRLQMLEQMQRTPILLMPTSATTAFRHGERRWTVAGREIEYLQSMSYCQVWNLLGNPGVSVPVSLSSSGLPIGVQLVGRPYAEESLLDVAEVIDRAFGYRQPPIANAVAAELHA